MTSTFPISSENRRNLIIAVGFQFFYLLFHACSVFYEDSDLAPDVIQNLLLNAAHLIAYAYTFKVLYAYLKFHRFTRLSNVFLALAVFELLISLMHTLGPFIAAPDEIMLALSLPSLFTWGWLAFLFYREKIPGSEPSFRRFRQFAFASIIIFFVEQICAFLFASFWLFPSLEGLAKYASISLLLELVPQVFLFLFALEVGKGEETEL